MSEEFRIGDLVKSRKFGWVPFAPTKGFVISVDEKTGTMVISNVSPHVDGKIPRPWRDYMSRIVKTKNYKRLASAELFESEFHRLRNAAIRKV